MDPSATQNVSINCRGKSIRRAVVWGADKDEQLSPKNICLSVPPGEVRILQLSCQVEGGPAARSRSLQKIKNLRSGNSCHCGGTEVTIVFFHWRRLFARPRICPLYGSNLRLVSATNRASSTRLDWRSRPA